MRNDSVSRPTSNLRDPSSQLVLDQIDRLLPCKDQIADELETVATDAGRRTANRMLALSRWFRQPRSASDVLYHSDALVVFAHLINHSDEHSSIQSDRIVDATRHTVDRLRHQGDANYRLMPKMIYPFLLIVIAFGMCVLASFFLIADFSVIFDDFEFETPRLTKILVGLAASTRRWWIVGAIALAVFGTWLFGVVIPGRSLPAWTRVFRIYTLGLRKAWAVWAWHTGWLLKLGIGQSDAVAIAGSCSTEPWLRRGSAHWSDRMAGGTKGFAKQPRGHWEPYGLLAHAFELEDADDQAAILHTYAQIQQEQSLHRTLWWLSWLTPVIMLLVVLMVGIFLIAIFAQMLSLLDGFGNVFWSWF